MVQRFFSYAMGGFVITIILWTFSTLRSGKNEYILKIIAWYFLMVAFGSSFARLYYTTVSLPPFVGSIILFMSFALTFPIISYLKKILGEKDYKDLRNSFLILTIVLSVLAFILSSSVVFQ